MSDSGYGHDDISCMTYDIHVDTLLGCKEQNIGIYGYIGTWILRKYRKYRKISVDILTKISVMQKLTKIL